MGGLPLPRRPVVPSLPPLALPLLLPPPLATCSCSGLYLGFLFSLFIQFYVYAFVIASTPLLQRFRFRLYNSCVKNRIVYNAGDSIHPGTDGLLLIVVYILVSAINIIIVYYYY
jgi:hypothetical protein